MRNLRKFSSAFFCALLVAAAMSVSSVSVVASSRKPNSGPAQAAICAYLKAIIDYPHTTIYVKVYAVSLYNRYKCGEI